VKENNNMTLAEQMDIAKRVYDILRGVDPYCILAGGAPADWYLKRTANDLDFYYFVPRNWTNSVVDKQIERNNPRGLLQKSGGATRTVNQLAQYEHMKNVKNITEYEYDGMQVHLMRMLKPTFGLHRNFSAGVTEAWWTPERGVEYSKRFLDGHENKVISAGDMYTLDNRHIKKLMKKYPDYRVETSGNLGDYK